MLNFFDIPRITNAQSRSVSAENPTGAKGGGARASPGDDEHCTPAASDLGRGWKVRPCLRNFDPGRTFVLADIEGPGTVRHIWMTILEGVHRFVSLKIFYDGAGEPSVHVPLGDFFANGLDGLALVNSLPVVVNPKGGMNCYWPMPFRKKIRIEVTNDGPKPIPEMFFQVNYELDTVPDDAGYFHAEWRRTLTTRSNPEHIVLDNVRGRGHYVGTYCVWNQLSNHWWGEGEVKFFIDGDKDSPTICGTGTEDYFGGAWGFVMNHAERLLPQTYSTPFLGYPQAVYEPSLKSGPRPPAHALYRWHMTDPIRFRSDLKVSVQALGWWPNSKFQPLTDDIATVAYWYQAPNAGVRALPRVEERFAR